ncbi:methyltransferase domain-containing protein [Streptosporangium carneum]|uniref:Similarity with UbiE/COQ5 methyltransferase n=1 Tax=Streptosporangium carneum TaxID=47481 RepID=A0A9W6I532_9ACTN|nr:methyltransferase domain-containing protein [Streptosporangium carneum]GLK11586.1 similarity with UbiE/COQ5 methyltransferase [Streptosporangium carneum]
MSDAAALERVRELLDPALLDLAGRRPPGDGYLDLLDDEPVEESPVQWLMRSSFLPRIYERVWRPAVLGTLKGPFGPSTAQETALVRRMLELGPGDLVLDVACGPGNVTRTLAQAIGEDGLAVGIDASATMLTRAVRDTASGNVVYVRGDAVNLPFLPGLFDAVCCLAALYLFDRPFDALAGMARALRPGGRIAVMTTRRLPLGGPLNDLVGTASGVRLFGDEEVTEALARLGFSGIRHRAYGLVQFIGGRLV